jgi:cold shock CspA family protein
MGRSQETFNKKEVRKNKEKKRQDKEKKRNARKDGDKNSFEDMIAYVDENGQITSTPPNPTKKREETKLEDIEISVQKRNDEDVDPVRTGIVSYFNTNKGYGFIRDNETKESIFVHANNLQQEIQQDNRVNFEIEKGPKGYNAINVRLAK